MEETKEKNSTCRICEKTFSRITESHVKTHGVTLSEYKLLFGNDRLMTRRCLYQCKYTQFHCNLTNSMDSDNGYCILHNNKNLEDKNLFQRVFQILMKLYNSCENDFHFEGIRFPDDLDLSYKLFDKNTYFVGAEFKGRVDFSSTRFNGVAFFRNCIFHQTANFGKAKFFKRANFRLIKFMENVTFQSARFVRQADFGLTEFKSEASFNLTTFENSARFPLTKFSALSGCIRFTNTRFLKPGEILFAQNDFQKVLFRYTDLSLIKFENVKWPKKSKREGRRRYLADEVDIKNKSYRTHYEDVRILYLQLKRNFEERKNFLEAGDFYYGEMECYRKSNNFRRYFPLNFVNLFRISSGYGQRYIRAGIVLLLLLVTFASAHMVWGLEPAGNQEEYQPIQYKSSIASENLSTTISDFFKSTIYCIQVLTRISGSDRLYRPVSFRGEALNSIFSILIYLQAVFFALALRRHFKR